jgi:hypothetical protein
VTLDRRLVRWPAVVSTGLVWRSGWLGAWSVQQRQPTPDPGRGVGQELYCEELGVLEGTPQFADL